MMKKNIFSLILILVSTSLWAYDKDYVSQHIRKALNLDTRTPIEVSTKSLPSGFGNVKMVPVTINGSPFQIFLSNDEKKYIWGYAIDLTIDPDVERAKGINLKNVRSKGSATAPVTLVEYSDFQCGHCKKAHDILSQELYKNYDTSTVRFVFKHFPLTGHEWAEPAAVATECAGDQKAESFWAMGDYFFENSVRISTANVKAETLVLARKMNLDMTKFQQCLDSPQSLEKVRADKKEGSRVGVSSTPSLFINGRMLRGFRDFEDIKVVINEKLAEAKQKKK